MSAAPIRIGPALRESAAVAIGHWPIVLLSLAALFVWSALVLIAITGCTPPLACIGPSAPGELDGWAALGIWGGTRFIGWIILGGVVYRTLIREAGLHATASEQRDPRLRLLLACVLCFAGSSLAVFALRAAVLTAVSAIGDIRWAISRTERGRLRLSRKV